MDRHLPARLLSAQAGARLAAVCAVAPEPLTEFDSPRARAALAGAEVLLTGWGSPPLDAAALALAPRLRLVAHAAGSVKGHVTGAVFDRGISVTSAAWANALPVAEYTLAMILLANKAVPALAREYRARRADLELTRRDPGFGNHRRTVGLVGASLIGRRVLELLSPFDLDVLVSDPYLDPGEALRLGARPVGLRELFAASDVVSLHAPATPETRDLVDAPLLAALRDGATLINTARGSLVDQSALVRELRTGRISAVLDVTEPEITEPGSPLWDLPNVVLTPHLAGSLGTELFRLGDAAVDEVLRAAAGLPPAHPVDPAALASSA
ncbi:hydroxyacid dehydrogenase [Streptacidiphilus sp. P02-A3a]|uniref:hydroxyacid dehydrogenase n=1 Tax=Streptacidiphilus sp. P02-A3a TaxID=2704468 RepID=UPI0015FE33E0|nr:hydroxyacid dehydrogenase [Streptacidiphilus sp. P02-A3a]QMU74072.1 hydroxyacid dehydrogenase [Streptacidiphilus sp. P02-A3a]